MPNRSRVNIRATRVKSAATVAYFTFVVLVAVANLQGNYWAQYAYPWNGYQMFPYAPKMHLEHILEGHFSDGMTKELDIKRFFSMPPQLIYRGHGIGVTYGTYLALFNSSPTKSPALCRYIIKRYHEKKGADEPALTSLIIKFRSYPLGEKGWHEEKPTGEDFRAECRTRDESLL